MALIDLLPGMGGDTGTLVRDSISTLENLAACGPEDPVSCFVAIVDLGLTIYDIFQTFFPSRPTVGKDSASDDTALFFIPSSNPIIALWGIGIRDLETQGIPTSASGGTGYAAQLKLADAVLADLQRQFDGPSAPRVTFGGIPVTGSNLFGLYHQLGFRAKHPDSNAVAIHERELLDQLYTTLVTDGYIDPKTGFPKTAPPPPPPPHTCPSGQHWDPTKNQCVPDNPPPPGGDKLPCPPYSGIPDCLPQPPTVDPDLDEIGQGFAASGYWLMIIAIYVGNLFEKLSGGPAGGNTTNADPVTCQQLSVLMGELIAAVKAIEITNPTAEPIDWTPLLDVLQGTPLATPPPIEVPKLPPLPPYTTMDAATDLESAVQILFERTVPFGQ